MIIRLKDGSQKEYDQAMSVLDVAKDISEGLARNACAGEVNGETVDLRTVLEEDCDLQIRLLRISGSVDTGKHFIVFVASPVRAG